MFESNEWLNPMEEDYNRPAFNSYDRGPGTFLTTRKRNGSAELVNDPLRLFISQIPYEFTEDGFSTYLKSVGIKPIDINLYKSREPINAQTKNLGHHSALIEFTKIKDASSALQILDRTPPYYLRVRVAFVEKDKKIKEKIVQEDFKLYLELQKKAAQDEDSPEKVLFTEERSDHQEETMKENALSALTKFVSSDKLLRVLPNRAQKCNNCNDVNFVEHHHLILDECVIENPMGELPDIHDIMCGFCSSKGPGLQICSNCNNVYYCGRKCQKQDWLSHKTSCKSKAQQNSIPNSMSNNNLAPHLADKSKGDLERIRVPATSRDAVDAASKSVTSKATIISHPIKEPVANILTAKPVATIPAAKPISKLPVESPKTNGASKPISSSSLVNNIKSPLVSNTKSPIANNVQSPTSISQSLSKIRLLPKKTDTLKSVLETYKGGENVTGVVTQAWQPGSFKYFILFNVDEFVEICAELNSEFSKGHTQLTTVEEGQIVAVKASDEEWYRAYVMNKNEDGTIKVIMVDPGYIETVKTYARLPQKYYAKPAYMGFVTPIGKFDKTALLSVSGDEIVSLTINVLSVDKDSGRLRVKFDELDVTCEMSVISHTATAKALKEADVESVPSKSSPPPDPLSDLPTAELKINSTLDGIIVYQETDGSCFYILGDANVLQEIMAFIESAIKEEGEPVEPEVGLNCLAKSVGDGEWYRAVILTVDKKIKVYYIDFGNCDEFDDASALKSLTPELHPELKNAQGVKCQLADNCKTDKHIKMIAAACEEGASLPMKVLKKEMDYYVVSLL